MRFSRLVSQVGLDIALDVTSAAFQGKRPHRRNSVFLDALVQLSQQFSLRLGRHIAEDRFTVFLVTDDDAAFPAAVLPLAHHAVSGQSPGQFEPGGEAGQGDLFFQQILRVHQVHESATLQLVQTVDDGGLYFPLTWSFSPYSLPSLIS